MQLLKRDTKFFVGDFKKINKYNYATYTRDDDHGPRTYAVKDKKVPSVTTILSATESKDKKAGLDKWRARVGYQEAARITKQAATRGTEMPWKQHLLEFIDRNPTRAPLAIARGVQHGWF